MNPEHVQLLSDYNQTVKDLFEARQKIKELEKEIESLNTEKIEFQNFLRKISSFK